MVGTERTDHEGTQLQLVVGQHAGYGRHRPEHQVLVDPRRWSDRYPGRGSAREYSRVSAPLGLCGGIDDDQPGTRPITGHAASRWRSPQRQRVCAQRPPGSCTEGSSAVVGRVEHHHFVARWTSAWIALKIASVAPGDGHLAVGAHPASIRTARSSPPARAGPASRSSARTGCAWRRYATYRLAQLRRAVEIGKPWRADRATLGGQFCDMRVKMVVPTFGSLL